MGPKCLPLFYCNTYIHFISPAMGVHKRLKASVDKKKSPKACHICQDSSIQCPMLACVTTQGLVAKHSQMEESEIVTLVDFILKVSFVMEAAILEEVACCLFLVISKHICTRYLKKM